MSKYQSYLLVRVKYVGPQAGRKISTNYQELQFLANGEPLVLPAWEAEALVEKYTDLELVAARPEINPESLTEEVRVSISHDTGRLLGSWPGIRTLARELVAAVQNDKLPDEVSWQLAESLGILLDEFEEGGK